MLGEFICQIYAWNQMIFLLFFVCFFFMLHFGCVFHLRNGCSANCATGSLICEYVLEFDLQMLFTQTVAVKNAKHTHRQTDAYVMHKRNESDCIKGRQK